MVKSGINRRGDVRSRRDVSLRKRSLRSRRVSADREAASQYSRHRDRHLHSCASVCLLNAAPCARRGVAPRHGTRPLHARVGCRIAELIVGSERVPCVATTTSLGRAELVLWTSSRCVPAERFAALDDLQTLERRLVGDSARSGRATKLYSSDHSCTTISGAMTLWPPAPTAPSINDLSDDVVEQFGDDLLMPSRSQFAEMTFPLNSATSLTGWQPWRSAIGRARGAPFLLHSSAASPATGRGSGGRAGGERAGASDAAARSGGRRPAVETGDAWAHEHAR